MRFSFLLMLAVSVSGRAGTGLAKDSGETNVDPQPKSAERMLSVRGRVMIDGAIPVVPPWKLKPSFRGIIPRNADERLREKERWEAAPVVEIPDESLVISKDEAIANVAIYLKKAPAGWQPAEPPSDPVELRSEDNRFHPRMSIIRVGQPLRLLGGKEHVVNFHSFPVRAQPFNIVVPPNSKVDLDFDIAKRHITRESLPFAVVSDIQPWMKAWLIALDHPFAAITGADGRFEIRDLPPGEHHFIVWHERCGYLNRDLVVRVENGKQTEVDLKFTAEQLTPSDARPKEVKAAPQADELPNERLPLAGLPAPIAHWRLDDEGREARDSVGAHHGTIHGAVSHAGKVGKALLFDRSKGDHVSIAHAPDFEIGTFTVSAWVWLTKEPTFSGVLGTRTGGEFNFDMKVNSDKVHGDIGDGTRWIDTKINFYKEDVGANGQGGDLELRRWYLITFVVDNERKECRLYLDADCKKRIPFQGEPRLMRPGQTMTIGNTGAGEFMDGVIDDVRIWKHALTDQQTRSLIAP